MGFVSRIGPVEIVAPAGLALAIGLLVALAMLVGPFGGNVTGFFAIGDHYPLSPRLDPSEALVRSGPGYDGQFFLTVALDPLLRDAGSVGALDNPRYRYRRALYPFAGYVVGLGQPRWIPCALVGLNVAAIIFLVALVAIHRRATGAKSPPWTPLAALSVLGAWVSLSLSVSDLVGVTLFLAALVALDLDLEWDRMAALSLGLACLTRETYLPVVAIFLVWRLVAHGWRRALPWGIALAAPLAWNGFVVTRLSGGTSGFLENFGAPGAGIVAKLGGLRGAGWTPHNVFEAFSFLLLLAFAAAVITRMVRERRPSPWSLSVLPALAMLVFIGPEVLSHHGAHARAFMALPVAGLLIANGSGAGARVLRVLFGLSGVASVAYVVNFIAS